MPKRSFLLGVGAQKAGTSWLYRYLCQDDSFCSGYLKEYHIWDALTLPECSKFKARVFSSNPSNRQVLRGLMQEKINVYFEYFEALLAASGASLVADITPSYAGLSAQTLSLINGEFAARGIDCRPIFIMRDPIERCWSAVRMHNR